MSTVSDPGVAQTAAYALQLALGGVFLASVVPKLRAPRRFRRTVARYDILPSAAVAPAALLVTACEAALAVSFIAGWATGVGLAVAAALLLAFAAGTAITLRRGADIECGCFGSSSEKVTGRTLARLGALGLAVVVLAALLATPDAAALALPFAGGAHARTAFLFEALSISAALALATAWALEARTLASLLRRPPEPVGGPMPDELHVAHVEGTR